MFNRVREAYHEQISRAFKQAPWRQQTQSVAILATILLVMAILGGFYLAVAARAGSAGRDLQDLEQQKSDLIRENDELRATLADLRSLNQMVARAQKLGYGPVAPEDIEYLAVKNYPTTSTVAAQPAAPATPQPPATLSEWLSKTLSTLLSNSAGGG
jgi:cell division protein FtsL